MHISHTTNYQNHHKHYFVLLLIIWENQFVEQTRNYPAFQKKYGKIVDRVKSKVKIGSVSVTR